MRRYDEFMRGVATAVGTSEVDWVETFDDDRSGPTGDNEFFTRSYFFSKPAN